MAHPHVPDAGSERYSGPCRAELGSLADWMSEAEFLQLHAGSRPSQIPSAKPALQSAHHRRPERYSGPNREELGDLAAWLDAPTSSRPAGSPNSPPATSTRAMEAELWVSETSVRADRSASEPARAPNAVPERRVPDPFLDQLDEIEVALRKRSTA